jgi:hypothetical protein
MTALLSAWIYAFIRRRADGAAGGRAGGDFLAEEF